MLLSFDYLEAIKESYLKLQEDQEYTDIAIDRIEFSSCHLLSELTGSDDGTGSQLSQETKLNLFALVKVRKHQQGAYESDNSIVLSHLQL